MNELFELLPLGVAIVIMLGTGAFAVHNRRRGEIARREPSWKELVEENRAQREENKELREAMRALEGRFDGLEDSIAEQKGEIRELRATLSITEHRDILIYRDMKAMRNHILEELPPPPPEFHPEVEDWFVRFEREHPNV